VTAPREILVAGLGNVFLGDDGFGVAVVERLRARPLPACVRLRDFGIRSIDLAFALERCDAAILVDATARGRAPGTLYVLEPELGGDAGGEQTPLLGHATTPDTVLRALAPGARPRTVRVVGCEPESLGGEEGEMGLSAPVRAAVDEAAGLVEALVHTLLGEGAGRA
jgi:hydrogenase maturation protease